MRVGVAEARRRFSELLDRAIAGEPVEVARRGEIVAVITRPSGTPSREPITSMVQDWRAAWCGGMAGWTPGPMFVMCRLRCREALEAAIEADVGFRPWKTAPSWSWTSARSTPS